MQQVAENVSIPIHKSRFDICVSVHSQVSDVTVMRHCTTTWLCRYTCVPHPILNEIYDNDVYLRDLYTVCATAGQREKEEQWSVSPSKCPRISRRCACLGSYCTLLYLPNCNRCHGRQRIPELLFAVPFRSHTIFKTHIKRNIAPFSGGRADGHGS